MAQPVDDGMMGEISGRSDAASAMAEESCCAQRPEGTELEKQVNFENKKMNFDEQNGSTKIPYTVDNDGNDAETISSEKFEEQQEVMEERTEKVAGLIIEPSVESNDSVSTQSTLNTIDRPTSHKGKKGRIAKKSVAVSKRKSDIAVGIRYLPFFERHITIESETALVYIDGTIAARVSAAVSDPTRFMEAAEKRRNEVKETMVNSGVNTAERTKKQKAEKSEKSRQKVTEEEGTKALEEVPKRKRRTSSAQSVSNIESNSVEQNELPKNVTEGKLVKDKKRSRVESTAFFDSLESDKDCRKKEKEAKIEKKKQKEFIPQQISISGLSDEEISKKFGLQQFTIKLDRLESEDVLRLCEEIRNESARKNRKRNRRASSSSPESGREAAPSLSEQLCRKPRKGKKVEYSSRISDDCYVCHRPLNECAETWTDVLGEKSVYCSLACVQKQVDQAKELISDPSNSVMLLDRYGTMLNGPAAPTVETLYDFLCSHAEFTPVLPSQKSSKKKTEQDKVKKELNKSDNSKLERILSKDTDQRRLQVKRAIAEKLLARARKTPNLLFSSSELKGLSQKIEEELFRQCHQTISDKYRLWFKRFISNIGDESNKGLYLRVILGDISVPRLVHTDANELNSQSLSALIEIPKSKRIKNEIIDVSLEDTSKKNPTEGSESDGAGLMTRNENEKASETLAENRESLSKKPAPTITETESEVDKILGIEPMNTTAMHRFHLFDLNCDICTGKRERDFLRKKIRAREKALAKKKSMMEEHEQAVHPETTATCSTTNPTSTQEESAGGGGDYDDDGYGDGGFQMDDDDEYNEESSTSPEFYSRAPNRPVNEPLARPLSQNTSDLDEHEMHFRRPNDSWRHEWSTAAERLQEESWRRTSFDREPRTSSWRFNRDSAEQISKGGLPNWAIDRDVKPTESWRDYSRPVETLPKGNCIKDEPIEETADDEERRSPTLWEREERHIVWTGVVIMAQLFTFTTTLTAISNEKAFFLRKELQAIIRIIGRIKPIIVFDYLDNLRKSKARDVIVLRLDRPVHPEMEREYMKCFDDMRMRGRYCVLASEHVMLKDAYLIALAQNEEPPAVLLPFDGPGIPVNHPPMIICVIVRFKDMTSAMTARAVDTAASSMVNVKSERAEPPPEIFDPEQSDRVKEIPLEAKSRSSSPAVRPKAYNRENRCFFPEMKPLISPTMICAKVRENIKVEEMKVKEDDVTAQIPCEQSIESEFSVVQTQEFSSEERSIRSSPVCRSSSMDESRIDSNLFDPVALMLAVNSISDLLLAIHTYSHPSQIAMLVSEYTEKNTLTLEEEKMIEKAVQQKVIFERKKRGEIVDDNQSIPQTESAKPVENLETKQGKVDKRSIDFSEGSGSEDVAVDGGKMPNTNSSKTEPYKVPLPPEFPVLPEQPPALPSTPSGTAQLFPPPPPPPPPPPLPPAPLLPPGTSDTSKTVFPIPVPQPTVISNLVSDSSSYFPPLPSSPISLTSTDVNPTTSVSVTTTNRGAVLPSSSPEGEGTAGEMDMDISDDETESAKVATTSITLLPPPPPPPAFNVLSSPVPKTGGRLTVSMPSSSAAPFGPPPLPILPPASSFGIAGLTGNQQPNYPPTTSFPAHPPEGGFMENLPDNPKSSMFGCHGTMGDEYEEKMESLDHPYKVRESNSRDNCNTYASPYRANPENNASSSHPYTSSANCEAGKRYLRYEKNVPSGASWSGSEIHRNRFNQRVGSDPYTHQFFREHIRSRSNYGNVHSPVTYPPVTENTDDWSDVPQWTEERNDNFHGQFGRQSNNYAREKSWSAQKIRETSMSNRSYWQHSATEVMPPPHHQQLSPPLFNGPATAVPSRVPFNGPGSYRSSVPGQSFRGAPRGRGRGLAFRGSSNYW